MRAISNHELKRILHAHEKWLRGEGGERADLRRTNLRKVDLQEADLRKVNMSGADLRGANMHGANLCWANMRGAKLRGANMRGANMRYIDLRWAAMRDADTRGADMCYADMRGANMCDADMRDADLRGAKLRVAKLRGADMCGADLRDTDLRDTDLRGANLQNIVVDYNTVGIHPAPEGDLIGWGRKGGVLVKMLIPADAKRSCATTRKHRAEYVKVLEVIGADEAVAENEFGRTIYRSGEIVHCYEWDNDRWNECSGGIHFFLTREEAEVWEWST